MTKGKASFPKVLYGGRREMMPQRMIILKHRRNRAGRHKTGCPSLRHRKKVYRTSYTLVERCLTRTSQISFESHLFTSYVNDDKLIPKALSKFPDSSPITFTIRKLEKDRAVSHPKGVLRVILGGGVLPSSPNPDLISDQKVSFSTPFFRHDL